MMKTKRIYKIPQSYSVKCTSRQNTLTAQIQKAKYMA